MTSANHKTYSLTTANEEARHLIMDSRSLRLRFLDQMLYPKSGERTDKSTEAREILEESIRLARKALEIDPDSPDLAYYYTSLASSIQLLLHSTAGKSEVGTLDEAVHLSRLALRKNTDDRSEFRAYLWHNHAVNLEERHQLHGSLNDLREAAQAYRQVMENTTILAKRVGSLQSLTRCLSLMYENTRDIHDLEEAIRVSRQGMQVAPDNSKRFPFALILPHLLDERFDSTGRVRDLNEAILVGKQAIKATPEISNENYQIDGITIENAPSLIAELRLLTKLLMKRYTKTGANGDLEQAVVYGKQAVDLMPDTTNKTSLLDSFLLRSTSVNSESSPGKTETISLLNEVLTMTAGGVDAVNLGMHIGLKSIETPMSVNEIEERIHLLERQMEEFKGKLNLPQSALMPMIVSKLYFTKFSRTVRLIDFERGKALAEEALDRLTGHKDKYKIIYQCCLTTLNSWLNIPTFELKHSSPDPYMSYTSKSIQVVKQLSEYILENNLKETTGNDGANVAILNEQYFFKCCVLESLSNSDQAIVQIKEYINTLPENDPLRVDCFETLSQKLLQEHQATKDRTTLENAICAARAALAASEATADPPLRQQTIDFTTKMGLPQIIIPRPGKIIPSLTLFHCLKAKYLATGEIAALNEAIQVLESMVDEHGDSFAVVGIALTTCFVQRYESTKSIADLEKAFDYARSTLRDANSLPHIRIAPFELLVILHPYMGHKGTENLFQDAVLAVGLIPRMIMRSAENFKDNLFLLSNAVRIASNAAALALETDKDPIVALELLESGRSVIVAYLQDLRANASDLRDKYPVLAERLTRLQKELGTPASPKLPMYFFSYGRREDAGVDQLDRRDQAVREFDTLIEEIRQLPGFESFLGSPRDSDILGAASNGPLAVINVSQIRCDAILVERDRIRSLPLPNLSLEDIKKKAEGDDLGSSDILAWLWATIACPVLRALGYIQPLSTYKDLPRMWWIPTGLLSRFPLHAAGYHGKRSNETVIDRVMSSYNCSIKAVISGRRRHTCATSQSAPGQALLVAMPQTRGYDTLHHSTREVTNVHDICRSMSLKTINLQMPNKPDILRNLPDCKIFHFAGHAHADNWDPSNCQLYLHDWKDNPLRVSDLLNLDLHAHAPFLAYLSACDTGRIREDLYLDESIHLVSAFYFAGFRHVIGTLWSIDDEWGVEISRITYEGIREGGLTDESVCRGLHNASRTLRNRWVDKMTPEERECRYEDINQSTTQGKRLTENPTGTPESHGFFEGEASIETEKDAKASLEDYISKYREAMKYLWTRGRWKYSDLSPQVRTVTRGGSDIDSVGSSCSLPDLDDLHAPTTDSWTLKTTQSQAGSETLNNFNPLNDLYVSNDEARASSRTELAIPDTLQDITKDLNASVTQLGLLDRDREKLETSASPSPSRTLPGSVKDKGGAIDASLAHRELWSLFRAGNEQTEPLQEAFRDMASLDSGLNLLDEIQGSINALNASKGVHGVNRGPRKVDRVDGEGIEEGSKETARAHWVRHIHVGV